MKQFWQVNQIKSKGSFERAGETPDANQLLKHIGDYDSLAKATKAYTRTKTGLETDKQLLFIDEQGNVTTLLTTF